MKKTLIALAVLAASGASMAQVTLYGVADLSLASVDAPGVKSDLTLSGNGTLNNGGSRWGIKGVEDLGGGLKADFNFEQQINYENGAASVANSRYAYMGLTGGFGRIKAGRTLTPSFFGMATWELTGVANYTAVGNQFGFGGNGNPRNDSQISYAFGSGGFSGELGHVTALDMGATNSAKWDAMLAYKAGPLAVGFSYNKVDNASDGNYSLGANYNMGSFIVAGSFQDPAGKSQGFTIGATLPMGPWAFTVDVAQDTGFDDTNYLFEAKYNLSKRTFVYGAYHHDGKSGDAVKKSAVDTNTVGLGIRHNF